MTSPSTSQPRPALTFDAVKGRLNVFVGKIRSATFGQLVVSEARALGGAARILDVGCGEGLSIASDQGSAGIFDIKAVAGELWGVEPDPNIVPHAVLDRFVPGTLEDAELPDGYFDILFAHYVVEHVSDPEAFLRRAFEVLRPGGRLLFITPNARHYFVPVSRLVTALRLEKLILRWFHPTLAEAHYPTTYLLNREGDIERAARAAGFAAVEFAYFDHGDIRDYFPRGLKFIPIALEHVVRALGQDRLPALVARLVKAPASGTTPA